MLTIELPRTRLLHVALLGPLLLAGATAAVAQPSAPSTVELEIEAGAVGFSRNDVRIPNDGGTTFDMIGLTGNGPDPFGRLAASWDLHPRHGLRFVIAPLEVTGSGMLAEPTVFADEVFSPGMATGTYQFNVYKIIYRYTFHEGDDWQWRVGFTGLIRDANVALRQGALQANDDNVGFAPLVHLYGERRIGPRWRLIVDFDGLAAPQGRAIDVALKASYDLSSRWSIGGGYRTLEGGADNDDVYNFAWLHYVMFTASYRF